MNSSLSALLLTAALALSGASLAQTDTAPAPVTPDPVTSALGSGQQAAQLAAEARDLMVQARAAYPVGSANIDQPLWKQAAERAEAAVSAAPGNPDVLKLRAQIYTEVGFWKQAEASWAAYFKVAPVAAGQNEARAAGNVQYNLGYAAYTRGQPAQAAAYFKSCLRFDPQSLPCATWAARTALEGGDYALAQTLYTQALSLAPQDKTLNYFALVARNAGTYGPAATQAFSRAYASLDAGRKAEALAGFQEAARSAPNFVEAQREAGRLALELGNPQAALSAYQALTALPGATAADRYNLALAQEGQQYGLKAVQTFRAAYGKYAAGDKAGAEAGFLQATNENLTYPKAWAWLGRVRYERQDYAGAAEAYGRAVALDPNDKSSAYFLRLAQQGK
ncbi:tetratricopeptide repeat protein [Deinococcus sp. VB142]|uniref:Tetratricopeptide repeat protein n=1 Tax=Deinococcus sp. VB142 TaxID=3112952 RepID=A0AAU6PZI0_9DEIO